MALLFMAYIFIWSLISRKTFKPIFDDVGSEPFAKRMLDLLPVLLLTGAVIGSIYSGVATEAAALGVLATCRTHITFL